MIFPLISISFSKHGTFQGLDYIPGTSGDAASSYPGGLEDAETTKGNVV